MYVSIVYIKVKPEYLHVFREASLDNAFHSLKEPGILRFDVLQQEDDPTRFVLYEVYRSPDDPPKHRETVHYLRWRDTVAEMMAEARTSTKYYSVFPEDRDELW